MSSPRKQLAFASVLAVAVASAFATPACDGQQDDLNVTQPPPKDLIKSGTEEELRNLAKELFAELKPELVMKCAQACHDTATVFKAAPTFLAGPDQYASIKKFKIITEDPTQSPIVNKGEHEGPALNSYPELSTKVFTWLRVESAAVEKKVYPTSDPIVVKIGPNEVDMGKTGIAGLKIKFDAALLGGILSITNMKVAVPAMEPKKGARVVRPLFLRISKEGKLFTDVTDTFSYVDETFPGGAESPLQPGGALFAGNGWVPFAAGDKIRIQIDKLEQADIIDKPKFIQCKPGAGAAFNTALGAGLTAPINCANCHGNRTPIIQLGNAAQQQTTCETLAGYINKTNPAQSGIVLKLTAPVGMVGHTGGKLAGADATNFINAWTAAVQGTTIWE